MFIPENELGVIVCFSQQAESRGIVIDSIQAQFPDAIIRKNGMRLRAEFELQASSFVAHRHDVRQCDLIICWNNDWPDSILPIMALSDPNWHEVNLRLPSQIEREASYWMQRALIAERKLKVVDDSSRATPSLCPHDSIVCETCNRTFAWPDEYSDRKAAQNALNGHQKAHKGTAYVCNYPGCSRSFTTQSGLNAHGRMHKEGESE